MNKPTRNDEQLLAETFHDDWESGAAAQFAKGAAAHARNRRRARQALMAAASLGVLAIGFFVAHERAQPPPSVAHARPSPIATAPSRGYEIISDEDLLAQLRDRPVLAVRKSDGTRKIVVLESDAKAETLE